MEQSPRNNFRGGYKGRGNGKGRGNYHSSGSTHQTGYSSHQGQHQYRGRGRGRGGRYINSKHHSNLHAKSFEEILEVMTCEVDEEKESQAPPRYNNENPIVNSTSKRERGDDLDEDIVHKYRSLIKIDTPEELARWIENRKKNYPTESNIEKKRKSLLGENLESESSQPPADKNSLVGLDYGSSDSEPEVISSSIPAQGSTFAKLSENSETAPPSQVPPQLLRRKICKLYQQGRCPQGRNCNLLHSGPQIAKRFKTHKHENLFSMLQETEAKSNAPILLQALRLLNLLAASDASP